MNRADFLALDDAAVAAEVQRHTEPCWAIAMGGTRRGYIAAGGTLATPNDLEAYFDWADAAQCSVIDQLVRLGVRTIIAVAMLPRDRGATYQALTRTLLGRLRTTPARRALYQQHDLAVRVAGDLPALTAALDAPELLDTFEGMAADTAAARGPRLVHLFRGPWIDPATEEATLGYRLGITLGRPPTRAELVTAYYGADLPSLTVYVGSGRPQLGILRPPFLGGAEDCYWSQAPLMRLGPQAWRSIAYDHLYERRTKSARNYAMDASSRSALAEALRAGEGQIIGLGAQHPSGFWVAQPSTIGYDPTTEV